MESGAVEVSVSMDSCFTLRLEKDMPPICFFSSTTLGSPSLVYLNLKDGIWSVPLLVGLSHAYLADAFISRRAFDRLELHVAQVAAVHDEVVAGAHVGGLEAALEMLKSVKAQGDAELFTFVNGLFARGEAYGERVVVIGALDGDGDFAADGVGFAANHPCERSEVLRTGLFRGFNLE